MTPRKREFAVDSNGVTTLRYKSADATAIQWTGKNTEEVDRFVGADELGVSRANYSRFWTGEFVLTVYVRDGVMPRAWQGDWIVRKPNGELAVRKDGEFREEFEAA